MLNKKNFQELFFKEQLLFSFSWIVKQKKIKRSEKFGKFLFLKIYFIKKRLKGGISIYADFGPPRYVL